MTYEVTPDLAAGLCVGGRAGLDAETWTCGDAELRHLARAACLRCPVRWPCHTWAETLPPAVRRGVVIGGVQYGDSGESAGTRRRRRQANAARAAASS